MVSFLNPFMLAGAAAAVLPLVLHLLSRSRYRSVDWGAMMFLDGIDSRRDRRGWVHQWVLLAVRSAMIGLLAVALARPVVRGRFAAPAAGQPVTAVVLLDCSPSMGYEENGRSRIGIARDVAKQVVALHTGGRVGLVLMGRDQPPADRRPTADLWDVARRIEAAEPGYQRADVAAALLEAADALDPAPPVEGEPAAAPAAGTFARFYLITDRQAASWAGVEEGFGGRWDERLRQAGVTSRVFVLPVGSADADNLAVEDVALVNGPLVPNQPARLEVSLRNYGPVRWASLPLTVSVDKRVVYEQPVNLAPDSALTVPVTLRDGFPAAGMHVIAAEISRPPGGGPARPAGYAPDDRAATVVEVVAPVRVLVIGGDGGEAPAAGGTVELIRLALAPFRAAGRRGPDVGSADAAAADDWAGPTATVRDPARPGVRREVRLANYPVVVLADVERLTPPQARALEQYIYDGGGLLLSPGGSARPEEWDASLFRPDGGVLPAALGEPTADDGSEQTVLAGVTTDHPVFAFCAGRGEAPPGTEVGRYYRLSGRAGGSRELARFASGDPFLLELDAGPGSPARGRVLMTTTPLDGSWSNLPRTDFYLPFVQSAVRYLAGPSARRPNLPAGGPIEVRFKDPVPLPPPGRTVRVETPDRQDHPAELTRTADGVTARFADTQSPGDYLVTVGEPGRRPYTLPFVVRGPRDESDLTPLAEDGWRRVERVLRASRIDSPDRPLALSAAARPDSRELWAWGLAGLLLLAAAEMGLSRRWSQTPSGGGDHSAPEID